MGLHEFIYTRLLELCQRSVCCYFILFCLTMENDILLFFQLNFKRFFIFIPSSAPSLGGEYMVLHRGRGLWPWYLPSQKITHTPGSHSLFRSEPWTALSTRRVFGAFPVFSQRRFWFLMAPTCMQITCQQGVDGNWNCANFTSYCDPTTLGLPSNPLPSKVVSSLSGTITALPHSTGQLGPGLTALPSDLGTRTAHLLRLH